MKSVFSIYFQRMLAKNEMKMGNIKLTEERAENQVEKVIHPFAIVYRSSAM